jgi:ubiquinone/menaquinone biosynthesis C-methylase UbiE
MKISKSRFIVELENFVSSASDKCFSEIGEELQQNSLNLEQLKLIDYMRYAEFSAIDTWISLSPDQRILDVSSPQWFSMFLASKYPNVHFDYINLVDSEIELYKRICDVCEISNIQYHHEDVRSLSFEDRMFDKVITISVLEHIYPEQGGDLQALTEIKRVLKPQGEVLLTVPYKEKSNIIYLEGSVYERESQEKNFFAREYDRAMFDLMVKNSGFICQNIAYICEQTGILSLDYYQWGPGKVLWYAKYIYRLQQIIEKVVGHSIDGALAERYLHICDEVNYRVVNVAAVLKPI